MFGQKLLGKKSQRRVSCSWREKIGGARTEIGTDSRKNGPKIDQETIQSKSWKIF